MPTSVTRISHSSCYTDVLSRDKGAAPKSDDDLWQINHDEWSTVLSLSSLG